MSVPVIRVVAERIDDVVHEALDALCEFHPGVQRDPQDDNLLYAWTWFDDHGKARVGLRRAELTRALQEVALWVDARGVPIAPPLVVVRAVGDRLDDQNALGEASR